LCAALTFGIASTAAIADEDADFCAKLGQHGKKIIQEIYEKKKNLEGSSARVCFHPPPLHCLRVLDDFLRGPLVKVFT